MSDKKPKETDVIFGARRVFWKISQKTTKNGVFFANLATEIYVAMNAGQKLLLTVK